jgi:hypothetical protein
MQNTVVLSGDFFLTVHLSSKPFCTVCKIVDESNLLSSFAFIVRSTYMKANGENEMSYKNRLYYLEAVTDS